MMHTIHPTAEEEQLFQLILDAANYKKIDDVSIRVAGGWVRDKLLLQSSSSSDHDENRTFVDIDIALGGMNGVDFATNVLKEYMELLEQEGKMDKTKHKIGVISANPDQSKHLETATMTIFGLDIDFVNLRAEEIYTNDSRIPSSTNQFGTPLQDAMRRDFTINSLFYNLRTRQVEDYTKQGIIDLFQNGIIRTPVDPNQTFFDDPLRVLRAIRFGVRYGFTLHPEVRKAAMSHPIQLALQQKVSRERVGKELEGMLTGKNACPSKALQLVADLGLSESVFPIPKDISNYRLEIPGMDLQNGEDCSSEFWKNQWKISPQIIDLLSSHVLPPFQELVQSLHKRSDENLSYKSVSINIRMIHLSSHLLPFLPMKVFDKKGKEMSLPQWILKEGIKFKNIDIQSIGNYGRNLQDITTLLKTQFDSLEMDISRLEAGLLLRNLKAEWFTAFILATVSIIHQFSSSGESYSSTVQKIVENSINVCEQIIVQLNLNECWRMRPILDGKKVIQRLSLPKGPIVGVYLEEQVRYMLQHPNTTLEECEKHLLNTRRKRQLEGLDDIAPSKNKR